MKPLLRIAASVILMLFFITWLTPITMLAADPYEEGPEVIEVEENPEQPQEEPQKDQKQVEEQIDFCANLDGIEVTNEQGERINNQINLYIKKNPKFCDNFKNGMISTSGVEERSSFKSWTDYRALGRKTPNFKLCSAASVDENGLLVYDGYYLVAMGSAWDVELGSTFAIVTDEGNVFSVMICDEKSDRHTEETRRATKSNGCIVEFYVDSNKLDYSAKYHGSVGKLSQFSGKIIAVIPLENGGK